MLEVSESGTLGRQLSQSVGPGSSASGPKRDHPDKEHRAAVVLAGMATEEETVQALTEVFLVSSRGYGVIHSGCGRTLIGQSTLNSFMELLAAMKRLRRKWSP